MKPTAEPREYRQRECVVFKKTREEFGGLSNMAAGFPIQINSINIRTSEALYQACRFPYHPHIQREIILQHSPMSAKMKSKPYRGEYTRSDWGRVRVNVMRWSLRVKLVQNWDKFSTLLLETGDKPIVEDSRRDDFWGAKRLDEDSLKGANILGRLLVELREEIRKHGQHAFVKVEPPASEKIPDFLFYGESIGIIESRPVCADKTSQGQAQQNTNPLFSAANME